MVEKDAGAKMPRDMTLSPEINNRIEIICQVYDTTLERLRIIQRASGNDLEALKEITKWLRFERHWSYAEIADLLFRSRNTIKQYLFARVRKFDNQIPSGENKEHSPPLGAHQRRE
jgi:DNA-directed RNA polymerase specialized sigma24 family protein